MGNLRSENGEKKWDIGERKSERRIEDGRGEQGKGKWKRENGDDKENRGIE